MYTHTHIHTKTMGIAVGLVASLARLGTEFGLCCTPFTPPGSGGHPTRFAYRHQRNIAHYCVRVLSIGRIVRCGAHSVDLFVQGDDDKRDQKSSIYDDREVHTTHTIGNYFK